MVGPRKYNDPRWKRPCYNCGYELDGAVCPHCGNHERNNPWKECPNPGCDGQLRAHHSYTSGGYKTGRLGCIKCGSTVNFAAKIETVVTPTTNKSDRPPGVIALMNELVGRQGSSSEQGTPRFIRFIRRFRPG